LEEVLDEAELLDNCKANDQDLLKYLTSENVVDQLLEYATKEPSIALEEKIRFKYANASCEVLIVDSPAMVKCLNSQASMYRIWSMISSDTPLNPIVASYFLKLWSAVLMKKPIEASEFLKANPLFMDRLIFHISISAIADALLLTSVVDFPGNDLSFQRVLHLVARADHKWLLLEVKLAEKLVGVLNVDRPLCDDSIFQICRVLQDIVISARHESQSPTDTAALLLAAVLQPSNAEALVQHILRGHPSSLKHGLPLLLAILQDTVDEDSPRVEVLDQNMVVVDALCLNSDALHGAFATSSV